MPLWFEHNRTQKLSYFRAKVFRANTTRNISNTYFNQRDTYRRDNDSGDNGRDNDLEFFDKRDRTISTNAPKKQTPKMVASISSGPPPFALTRKPAPNTEPKNASWFLEHRSACTNWAYFSGLDEGTDARHHECHADQVGNVLTQSGHRNNERGCDNANKSWLAALLPSRSWLLWPLMVDRLIRRSIHCSVPCDFLLCIFYCIQFT